MWNSLIRDGGRVVWNARDGLSRGHESMIERCATGAVEGIMTRTRTVLISLIPAFWLVTAMSCLGQSLGAGNHASLHGYLVNTGHGTHDFPCLDSSLDQACRRAGRRINIQPSEDDFSPPSLVQITQLASEQTAGLLLHLPAGLAQRWQFLWRTASEPRAPSSASPQRC
jgi:hypothetical protein